MLYYMWEQEGSSLFLPFVDGFWRGFGCVFVSQKHPDEQGNTNDVLRNARDNIRKNIENSDFRILKMVFNILVI